MKYLAITDTSDFHTLEACKIYEKEKILTFQQQLP